MSDIYTVISFAPVQGFIEKSRKLRDLFGSSYLLSFLSWAVCYEIEQTGCEVVSPALSNVTQGMPNQIVVQGAFPKSGGYAAARQPLDRAWRCIVETCQRWLETHPELQEFESDFKYWQRDWGLWASYTWEYFWVQGKPGDSISDVRDQLNDIKRARSWTGINWVGESSTLSGADAIAYPQLGAFKPRTDSYRKQASQVETFYTQLSQVLSESFISPDEELSIPELIKRMITNQEVAKAVIRDYESACADIAPNGISAKDQRNLLTIAGQLKPESFKDLNRQRSDSQKDEPKYWTGWFLGDGDSAGTYLKSLDGDEQEASKLKEFSAQMRKWGCIFRNSQDNILPDGNGRIIYAGGDDFLGVLYGDRDKQSRQKNTLYQLQPFDCLEWFSTFKSQVWDNAAWDQQFPLPLDIVTPRRDVPVSPKPITVSVGFVWAAPNVPQRDVLQHCRETERAAKQGGRDRLAFRILFNGGNHLEWVCPWWLLEGDFKQFPATPATLIPQDLPGLLKAYRDRNGISAVSGDPNWTHLYNDVAALETRHAFRHNIEVALSLIEVYFGSTYRELLSHSDIWWNRNNSEQTWKREFSGILGDLKTYRPDFEPDHDDLDEVKNQLRDNPFVIRAFNTWVKNLAKVSFHLHREVTASGGAIAA